MEDGRRRDRFCFLRDGQYDRYSCGLFKADAGRLDGSFVFGPDDLCTLPPEHREHGNGKDDRCQQEQKGRNDLLLSRRSSRACFPVWRPSCRIQRASRKRSRPAAWRQRDLKGSGHAGLRTLSGTGSIRFPSTRSAPLHGREHTPANPSRNTKSSFMGHLATVPYYWPGYKKYSIGIT